MTLEAATELAEDFQLLVLGIKTRKRGASSSPTIMTTTEDTDLGESEYLDFLKAAPDLE